MERNISHLLKLCHWRTEDVLRKYGRNLSNRKYIIELKGISERFGQREWDVK